MTDKLKITTLFAFVAKDLNGDEGIIAYPFADGVMPLVGADMARIKSLAPFAKQVAEIRGTPLRLLKFDNMVELDINDYIT